MKRTTSTFFALAAALLAASPPSMAGLVVTPSDGFVVVWDGNDGDGFNPESPAPVPENLAIGAGAEAFTSSDLGPLLSIPFHRAINLNDGLYGNSNSWIGGDTPNPFAAISLGGAASLSGFAFGRDNGNGAFDDSSPGSDACGGQCDDRSLGVYTVQITRVAAPDAATEETGDAATGWQTIGTLDYQSSDDREPDGEFTSYFRHRYEIAAAGGGGILATGFRLLVPATGLGGGTAIDEIELFGPAVVDPNDLDGDGFTNAVEVELGTNPNDPASTPEGRSDIRTAVEFSFWAAKGKKYRIEASTDLQNWTLVEDNVKGTGGEIERLYSTEEIPNRHFRAVNIP